MVLYVYESILMVLYVYQYYLTISECVGQLPRQGSLTSTQPFGQILKDTRSRPQITCSWGSPLLLTAAACKADIEAMSEGWCFWLKCVRTRVRAPTLRANSPAPEGVECPRAFIRAAVSSSFGPRQPGRYMSVASCTRQVESRASSSMELPRGIRAVSPMSVSLGPAVAGPTKSDAQKLWSPTCSFW